MDLSCSGLSENDTRFLWDDFWEGRDTAAKASWAKRRIIDIISEYVRPGASVLDAGCGSGFFSRYFISNGCEVHSMDYSKEALSLTRKSTQGRSKTYIEADILDEKGFPGFAGGFDIIFTDGLLEHYTAEARDRIFTRMKVLKAERGCIINFVPNRFSFWSAVRPFCMRVKEEPFLLSRFLDLHRRNGLKIVSCGGINVLPFKASPDRLLGRYLGMLFYCVAV